jgi:hypothetical protein
MLGQLPESVALNLHTSTARPDTERMTHFGLILAAIVLSQLASSVVSLVAVLRAKDIKIVVRGWWR